MILSIHLILDVLVYIHYTVKAKLHCSNVKMRGISLNSLSSCTSVNVQQASLENCPLALICVGRLFLPTNAFDPIQMFLQVTQRIFSHLVLETAFPLSPSAPHCKVVTKLLQEWKH